MTHIATVATRRFIRPINALLALIQGIELRGKHRLYTWMSEHYANRVISHRVGTREFVVPVDEWCFWLEKGPQHYYLDEFVPFFQVINQIAKPFSFIDLGADIGTVSALTKQYCPGLHNILAFEPNPHSFQLLSHNLAQLNTVYKCENTAVSNIDGFVAFTASGRTTIDHEGAINPDLPGDTRVCRLDSWLASSPEVVLQPYVVLKIDVEGQELQVIQGAAKLIQQADIMTVLLEIHPDVLEKTATKPEQLFAEFEKLRAFNWYVPKLNNQSVDRSRDFFAQFPLQQFDVIGCSVVPTIT